MFTDLMHAIPMTRHALFLGFATMILFVGCHSAQDVQINYSASAPFVDGSREVSMATVLSHDTIDYGTARIFEKQLQFVSQGDTLAMPLWYPAASNTDETRLVVLIPGYGASQFSLIPLALSIVRRGEIVGMLTPRGEGVNQALSQYFRIEEATDLRAALDEYQASVGRPIQVTLFGSSVGSITALNVLANDSRARRAVLESMMGDPLTLARSVLDRNDFEALHRFLQDHPHDTVGTKPYEIFEANRIHKPVLVIWGEKDQLVPESERITLRQEIQTADPAATFFVLPQLGHALRFGYPLSQNEVLGYNNRITDFLLQF